MYSIGRKEERSTSQSSAHSGRSSRDHRSDSEYSTERSYSSSAQSQNHFVNKQPCDGLVKLLMIGEASVGKSSLLQRYVDDDFQINWIATIGIDIRLKMEQISGQQFKVQIWDTAGQERFRAITRRHFQGVDGCCIVFDVTSRQTFERLPYWIDMANASLDNNVPRVIFGNKIDLIEKRAVSYEEAFTFCRSHGITYVESSAMTGENVETGYFNLVKECLEKDRYRKYTNDGPERFVQAKKKAGNKTRTKCC